MSRCCGEATEHIHLSYFVSDRMHGIVTIYFSAAAELNTFNTTCCFVGYAHENTVGVVRCRCKHIVVFRKA